jgi:hypothetical protein
MWPNTLSMKPSAAPAPAPDLSRRAQPAYRNKRGNSYGTGPDSRLGILTARSDWPCAAPAGSIALGSVQRSSPPVEIDAALAADLGILTAALDEPGADVAHSLRQLTADTTAAIPTFLGLSVTVDGSDPPFTFTTFVKGAGAGDARTSLSLALPDVSDVGLLPALVVVLYAASPGTFVDLAADLAWLTARPLSDFVLDQHLPAPAERGAATGLFEVSVINQAIGALIGEGYTFEQAEHHLTAEGADAGISRHAVGLRILAALDGQ